MADPITFASILKGVGSVAKIVSAVAPVLNMVSQHHGQHDQGGEESDEDEEYEAGGDEEEEEFQASQLVRRPEPWRQSKYELYERNGYPEKRMCESQRQEYERWRELQTYEEEQKKKRFAHVNAHPEEYTGPQGQRKLERIRRKWKSDKQEWEEEDGFAEGNPALVHPNDWRIADEMENARLEKIRTEAAQSLAAEREAVAERELELVREKIAEQHYAEDAANWKAGHNQRKRKRQFRRAAGHEEESDENES
jgi:hypothetical protein